MHRRPEAQYLLDRCRDGRCRIGNNQSHLLGMLGQEPDAVTRRRPRRLVSGDGQLHQDPAEALGGEGGPLAATGHHRRDQVVARVAGPGSLPTGHQRVTLGDRMELCETPLGVAIEAPPIPVTRQETMPPRP